MQLLMQAIHPGAIPLRSQPVGGTGGTTGTTGSTITANSVNSTDAQQPHTHTAQFTTRIFGMGPDGAFQMRTEGGGGVGDRQGMPGEMDLNAILQGLFPQVVRPSGTSGNPFFEMLGMAGNPGDYVFDNRSLDNIVSRLMEQTAVYVS